MAVKKFGNPVVHFEMPYEDKDRVAEFYEKAFGWKIQKLGPEMGEYVLAQTGEMDENNMMKEPGMINGGFFKKTKDPKMGGEIPSVVISVPDIREAMKKVEEAGGTDIGGKTRGEPDNIPGIGLYVSFIDTEGNRTGMLEPVPMKITN
jgi:predicted enzyme related to lactoylglutathione lyase